MLQDPSLHTSSAMTYETYKQEGHDGPVTLTWATEHFESLI